MRTLHIVAAATLALVGLTGSAMALPASKSLSLETKSDIVDVRARFRCVAAGFTIRGRRIRGVRGVAAGVRPVRVCRRAMRQCRIDLRRRQRFGRNPLGRCRVVRRGFHF